MTARYLSRLITTTAAAALFVGIGVRAQGTGQQAATAASQGPLAPEKYKNIQVLNNVPADELRPSMDYFTAALGVQCNFCHVPDHFEADDRPEKKTARQMIQMVQRFNADSTNKIQLGCATCHHGHNQPERTPPLATDMTPDEAAAFAARQQQMQQPRGGGPGAPAADAGRGGAPGGQQGAPGAGRGGFQRPTETVDDVVGKYVQAMGGDALAKARTRVIKGTVTSRDLVTVPFTTEETSSGNYRMAVDNKQGTLVRVWNGKDAWIQSMGQVRDDLDRIQAAQVHRLADFNLPTNIKQRFTSLTVSRYGNIDNTPTIGLVGRADQETEQLQFNRDTGLLMRRAIQTRTPFGTLMEQVDYSDYRDVSGIKVPFLVTYATWNQVTTEKLSEAQINAPVDDAAFTKK